jgi:hypothetical protein
MNCPKCGKPVILSEARCVCGYALRDLVTLTPTSVGARQRTKQRLQRIVFWVVLSAVVIGWILSRR